MCKSVPSGENLVTNSWFLFCDRSIIIKVYNLYRSSSIFLNLILDHDIIYFQKNCEHHCDISNGIAECSCFDGYVLDQNQINCTGGLSN